MSQYNVILLLGTNLGDRKKNILTSMLKIEEKIGKILKKSELLETKPAEFCSSNYFINFALLINTSLSPIKLLNLIKKIEVEMGREVDSAASGFYSDRIIDIDIVKYDSLYFSSKKLNIPHYKHLYERDFSVKLIRTIEL